MDAAEAMFRGGVAAAMLAMVVVLPWLILQAVSLGSAVALVASFRLRPPMRVVTMLPSVGADTRLLVRSWQQSEWTEEDRALMLARDVHRATLCPGCGQPKDTAWHPDNDGWFEVTASFECHSCTELRREGDPSAEPVIFHAVTDTRDYEKDPLPPMPTGPRLSPDELLEAMGGADL